MEPLNLCTGLSASDAAALQKYSAVQDFRAGPMNNLAREYEFLRKITMTKAHQDRLVTDASLCSHNRYSDVLAYADNLPWLNPDAKTPYSYVHANVIRPPPSISQNTIFFASQAPILAGITNFFALLMLNRIAAVVNLVEPKEVGKKCFKYWTDPQQPISFDQYTVTCESKESIDHIERRVLLLRNGVDNSEHRFVHIHFLSWVDHYIPQGDGLVAFLSIYEAVQQTLASSGQPVLVHCSAGIGRTGTFIAGYYLWLLGREARSTGQPFRGSVFEICRGIREQRFRAIETDEQYAFLYSLAGKLANNSI